ncbi:MAG: glycosyltransferase family 4 protein [Candidatus Eremiobacteraeota bacterium]|nr:glycosyltransferase family 4 protein [Candidatus Eremiobacteraeota bacterium]
MHVAVDAHNLLTDRRGIGVAVRAVLGRWIAEESCELTLLVRRALPMLAKKALARELGGDRFSVASRVPARSHAVWHPWNGTFFDCGSVPSVATVHDVAPFAFPSADVRRRKSEQAPFLRTAATASRVLADSQFGRSEITRHLGIPPERIECVPLAADAHYAPGVPDALPSQLDARRYILYVGAIEPRKNVETLLRAWRAAFSSTDVALAMVSADAVPSDVIALRGLTVPQLRDAYRAALAVAFPSTYEGFGLPALEALACGAPLAVSRAASLPEVCGDAAVYVENPLVSEQWSEALQQIAGDATLRERLRTAGPQQAGRFSWERTARETLRALESVRRA